MSLGWQGEHIAASHEGDTTIVEKTDTFMTFIPHSHTLS